MGFAVKFNWVLQTEVNSEILVDKTYHFEKQGNRCFPLNTPIDLINMNREAVAKIRIIEFTNTEDKVTGLFQVIKEYTNEEKTILTQYWMENK